MDHDEYVDLDCGGWDVTGDPALDETGYRSPRQPSRTQRNQAQAKRDREQRKVISRAMRDAATELNKAETKRRNAERRGEPVPAKLEVIHNAAGRQPGWWKVEIGPNGARWVKVDQPGDGPRVTASTPTPEPVQPQPAPPAVRRRWWRRRPAPVEVTEPSPGVQVW
jgi:hypothetical protein